MTPTMTPGDPSPRLFCFGLGYTAVRLARHLLDQGWSVAGTCRAGDQARKLDAMGIAAEVFDGAAPGPEAAGWLNGATHVLNSVPPGLDGDPVLTHFGPALAVPPSVSWLGYLSTTGVYGNTDGRIVAEDAPLAADVDRSRRRVEAEAGWRALSDTHQLPLHVFRLAGIYGPGRNQLVQASQGKARRIIKPGHQFSRIHVDDIVRVLAASMARPNPGAVYNVCDNESAEPARVSEFACDLLGLAPPDPVSFEDAAKTMSPMGVSFWQDNRRVDNSRIRDELAIRLQYPTYREGLQAIFETDFS